MSDTATDPLVLYDELLLAGEAPDPVAFARRYPDASSLLERIRGLERLRRELDASFGALAPGTPTQLGGFELLHLLGEGGMGSVYLARQLVPRRICALKILRHGSPQGLERFRREAELAARLSHPGIAVVYAFGSVEGHAYLATELVRGLSLRSVLRRADAVLATDPDAWMMELMRHYGEGLEETEAPSRPLPPRLATRIAVELADAVAHAHAAGVIHRDLKPSNVMLGFTGAVKLVDFGIAVDLDADVGLTHSGAFVGTVDYAAPEQLRGERQRVGPWTDVYALGATLFEMLTQQVPFPAAHLADRIARADVPPAKSPRALNPEVPAQLDALVMRALEPDPERRFYDAAELGEALRGAADRRSRGLTPHVPRRGWIVNALMGLASLAAIFGLVTLGRSLVEDHEARAISAALREHEQRAARASLEWMMEQGRERLERCLASRHSAEAPPGPRSVEAHLVVHRGLVTSASMTPGPSPAASTVHDCLLRELRDLELPGVGLGGPVSVRATLDLLHAPATP